MQGMFKGKSAIVTGGTSGIGRAITLALADAGCYVTATAVSADELSRFTNDPSARNISAVTLDVSDPAAIDTFIKRFDRLDILVNSAGMILRDGAEFKLDHFEQVLDVNLTGAMRMCTACHPLLAKQGGSILNIASVLSFF